MQGKNNMANSRWSAAEALSWIIRREPLGIREWSSEMGPSIGTAEQALASAIANGKVSAWGRPTPHGLLEKVPPDPFRLPQPKLAVGPHGDMKSVPAHHGVPHDCPRWHGIEFDASEIKGEWPAPPTATAMEWMLRDAQETFGRSGTPGKRDDMVKRCMADANCTKRDAEAAHKALPDHLRRPKGKPPNRAG
jgi:hypothetical protein